MKTIICKFAGVFFITLIFIFYCAAVASAKGPGGEGGHNEPEIAGNNLSYPVIWAEGVTKNLPGTPGMVPVLEGVWWYWWGMEGTDPNIVPLSCAPDPENPACCDDGVEGEPSAIEPGEGWMRAYLQKDELNQWQAESADWSSSPVHVHWIDWGDNLESVDWYTRSQVRTEVVLFQDLNTPMLEYEMRHVDGWGIDEVHGLAATNAPMAIEGEGLRATIYSHCARLTIQKLLIDREDPRLDGLIWVPGQGWTGPEDSEDELINVPIFNMAVHEGGIGPGYYSAEINVKGRIIYGYTWSVRRLNDMAGGTAAGDYRITFSLDELCGDDVSCNTFFVDGTTEILQPIESEITIEDESGGGGVAQLDFENNLTYMDIRILERSGGGGGGGKHR